MVRWLPIQTLSVPSDPGESVYPAGITDFGATSGTNSMAETCWSSRTSMNETSLYANCVPSNYEHSGQISPSGPKARGDAHLLPETDTRARVEREEDEGVRGEILLQALVEETVRVELQGCEDRDSSVTATSRQIGDVTIWAPQVLPPVHYEDRVDASKINVSTRARWEAYSTHFIPAGTKMGSWVVVAGRTVSLTEFLKSVDQPLRRFIW